MVLAVVLIERHNRLETVALVSCLRAHTKGWDGGLLVDSFLIALGSSSSFLICGHYLILLRLFTGISRSTGPVGSVSYFIVVVTTIVMIVGWIMFLMDCGIRGCRHDEVIVFACCNLRRLAI